MTPPRVAVTGASGFLGAAVARRLLADGSALLACVRPGTEAWRLAGAAPTAWFPLDLRSLRGEAGRADVLAALRAFQPDAVVHAAWEGVRGAARDDPGQVENVAAIVELVRVAAEAGARRFVGLGSQAEYGPCDAVLREGSPTHPVTMYGAAKLAAGHLALALARRLGMSAAWARVFSVYGPGQREGALVPDLARALRDGRALPLGSGDVRWDLLFEEDAGRALALLARAEGAVGFFNVASGEAVEIGDVARRVAALAAPGTVPALGARARGPSEPPRLEADVGKLRAATGFAPEVGLDAGLARTVASVL